MITFCAPGYFKDSHFSIPKKSFTGGIYSSDKGTITIAINKGVLTGVYEYYDKWNEKYHEYTDINVFYIYGNSSDNIHYKISTGWPDDDQPVKGDIVFLDNFDKLDIRLLKQTEGYAILDFTTATNDNIFPLKTRKLFKEIRIVKSSKAILCDYEHGIFTNKKAYLVNGNVVSIIDTVGEHIKVDYHSPVTDKSILYWMSKKDLFDANPKFWK